MSERYSVTQLSNIFLVASEIVEAAYRIFSGSEPLRWEVKRGGFLSCFRDGVLLFKLSIGSYPIEMWPKYAVLSIEKGSRLFAHPDHFSSFQSADEHTEKYPGAIRSNHWILSFSGLPALCDEAVCLVLAVKLCWLTEAEAKNIAIISSNHYFDMLMGACR